MSRTKSLRWKIQFWQLMVLLGAVVTLLVGFYFYEKKHRIATTDMQLAQLREPLFVKHIVLKTLDDQKRHRRSHLPDRLKRRQRQEKQEWLEEHAPEIANRRPVTFEEYGKELPPLTSDRELLTKERLYAKVWSMRGEELFEGGEKAKSIPFPTEHLDTHGHFYRWRNANRELVFIGKRQEVIVIGKCSSLIYGDLYKFALKLVGVGFGITGLALVVGWLTSRKIVRPIEEVCLVAERISGGNLNERVPKLSEVAELEGLIDVLNETFGKLSDSVSNQVRFTADASHELRTPLTIILNEAQWVLEKERGVADYKESAAVCEKSAQHMRWLIDALLELARFDAGDYTLAKDIFLANVLAEEVCDLLSSEAEKKGVTLVPHGGQTQLCADKPKVKQILLNLASNAIQHTPAGGRVTVASSQDGSHVVFEVTDTGRGIAPEEQEKLFERFFRGDKQESRETGGFGLGLAISNAIVQAHEGEIEVESVVGQGSTFRVTLPQ